MAAGLASIAAGALARSDGNDGVQRYLDQKLGTERVAFRRADTDLNGDGRMEVVVHLTSPAFCGSGGCNTLILKRTSHGFQTLMNATITRLPIRVLSTRTRGWRDIGVMAQGGGITGPFEARMRFDGRRYPSNPTLPPAERLRRPTGVIIIGE